MTYRDKNEFTETINISSNIRDNKNTIIGKFDLKDILFILIAGVVGIGVLSILLVALSIRNMFLILIVLALFEVPIVTLGFLKLHNIPVLDYIKMKSKSDNKSYRKQILRKKKSKIDKYIFTICIDNVGARATRPCEGVRETYMKSTGESNFVRLEQVLNDLYVIIQYKNIELKTLFNRLYLTIEVENIKEVLYDKLFDYLRINKDLKYVSNEDIGNFEIYINSLKFLDKKYGKKQNKSISELKTKLSRLKKAEETKDRYDYLTNRIIDAKDNEFTKVYKFLLYKSPFDVNIFDELKGFSNITSHIKVEMPNDKNVIYFTDLSFVDTFIDMIGTKEEINSNTIKVKEILDKHHILYKEINEEKVKDSLLFLMENRF